RDYFDRIAEGNEQAAVRVVDDNGRDEAVSYATLSRRSDQVANFLEDLGVSRGDRVLIMLGNIIPLWETMLACIKLGAVMIPATTLLNHTDVADRLARGQVSVVVAAHTLTSLFDGLEGAAVRVAV